MIGDFIAGAVAGLAVAMPIGAVGTYLIGLGARERMTVASAAALGVASVDGGYAVIAALSSSGVRALLSTLSDWLEWLAAIVLVVVAVRTMQLALRRYRGSVSAVRRPNLTPARAYLSLVVLTALNPATVITFAAVAVGRSVTEHGSALPTIALFAIGAFAASAVWQLLLTGGGNLLGRLFTGRRGQLGISACSALIMLGLSITLLLG